MENKDKEYSNLSEEIFGIFLDKLKKEKVSDDIVERLKELLSNENQVNEQTIKSAIFPEDV